MVWTGRNYAVSMTDEQVRRYSRLRRKTLKHVRAIADGEIADGHPGRLMASIKATELLARMAHPDVIYPPSKHGGVKAVLVVIESPPALSPVPMQQLQAPGAPVIIDVEGEPGPAVPDTEVLGGIGW